MRRTLFIILLLTTLLSISLLGGGILSVVHNNQKAQLLSDLKVTQKYLRDKFYIFDMLIAEGETELDEQVTRLLPDVAKQLDELNLPLDKISLQQLNKLSKQNGFDDIYIVNRNGIIINTNFAPDLNFNLKQVSQEMSNLLESLYGQGKVTSDRFNISIATGEIKKYSYYSPLGSDYIVEIAHKMKSYLRRQHSQHYVDYLFKGLFEIDSGSDNSIKEIDIFISHDIGVWSLFNPAKKVDKNEIDNAFKFYDGIIENEKSNQLVVYNKFERINAAVGQTPYVITKIKYDYSAQQRQLYTISLLVALLIIIVLIINLFILSYYFNRLFVTQVEGIIGGLKRLEGGSYLKLKPGKQKELNHIIAAINSLQERIKFREFERDEKEKALTEYQEKLEEKVRNRTHEYKIAKEESEKANLDKSRFLAAASHDLRQPIHAFSLLLSSLKQYVKQNNQEKITEVFAVLEQSLDVQKHLFDEILDISKLDSGIVQVKSQTLNVITLAKELETEFSLTAGEKEIALLIDYPETLRIHSDQFILKRVLKNLLSNAVKYTQSGSIELSIRETDNQIRFKVKDSGIGISRQEQENIFNEFYQINHDSSDQGGNGGLGLGLSIVTKLLALLDTQIKLHSIPGVGSEFYFDLPISQGIEIDNNQVQTESLVNNIDGKLIICIDDEKDVLLAMSLLLESWGCNAQTFANKESCFEWIKTNSQPVDLLLIDYRLGHGLKGTEIAEEILSRLNNKIPVIVISADTSSNHLQEIHRSGYELLVKPVDATQLKALIQKT